MPELPEVETTRQGIAPQLLGRTIVRLTLRQPALRWPIPPDLPERLGGQRIESIRRRGKYLLIGLSQGTLIAHLGMSGSLRIADPLEPPRPHDHYDLVLNDGRCLRYHDPRRFGCLLYTEDDPLRHPLLAGLGVEPLDSAFDGALLHAASRNRGVAIKLLLMDAHVVVGVGNIYANEALFRAGIRPTRPANRISRARYDRLASAIRAVLLQAIEAGGSTLRDYVNGNGSPGYFQLTLDVYDRAGEPCRVCATPIRSLRLGQRSTFYCPLCQR